MSVRPVQGTTDTLSASDNNNVVAYFSAFPVAVTLPPGLPKTSRITLVQVGAGAVTVSPASGVTLQSSTGTFATSAQWLVVSLTAYLQDSFVLSSPLQPGVATPYLGQVATRSNIAKTVNTSSHQVQTRTTHWARSNMSSFQIIVPNVYAKATGGEAGSGATAQARASFEDVNGNITRITFGGASTAIIPDNTYSISDPIPANLAFGDKFFIRIWFSSPGGILFSGTNSPFEINLPATDGFTFGVTTPDLTGGGAVAYNATFQFFPLAIIAQTTRASVCLTGDSRVSGLNDNVGTYGDLGEFARAIGPSLAYVNLGTPSDRASFATGPNYVTRLAMSAYCSHVLTNYGINDTGAGQTAAQLVASMNAFIALFPKNKQVWVATLPPVSTSTDSWATTVNQTPRSDNAVRITYNTDVRTGTSIVGAAGYIEMANVVESAQDSGVWAAPGYTTDGLHESELACTKEQASSVVPVWNFAR